MVGNFRERGLWHSRAGREVVDDIPLLRYFVRCFQCLGRSSLLILETKVMISHLLRFTFTLKSVSLWHENNRKVLESGNLMILCDFRMVIGIASE